MQWLNRLGAGAAVAVGVLLGGCGAEQGAPEPVPVSEGVVAAPVEPESPEDRALLRAAFVAARQAQGARDPRYAVAREPGAVGLTARNAGHGMELEFLPGEVAVRDERGELRLRTAALHCQEGRALPVEGAAPPREAAAPNRAEYAHTLGGAPVVEWYVNGELGLEQGWTLERDPCGADGESTRAVEVAVAGHTVRADGEDAVVFEREGAAVARYADVFVTDATGRLLPAGLEAGEGAVRVRFDVAGARWPVVVDPVVVTTEATLAHKPYGDRGDAVAIDGTTALISRMVFAAIGSVLVFQRSGTTWSEQASLAQITGTTPPGLAVLGNTALVGAPNGAGTAYVHVRTGTTWALQAQLTPAVSQANAHVGTSVTLGTDFAVLGAPDAPPTARGAAYMFVRTGTTWAETQRVVPSDPWDNVRFGASVAAQGTTLMVGAPTYPTGGMAYVFTRAGATWSQQAQLTGSPNFSGQGFGTAVSVNGTMALVGAPGHEADDRGAVYTFTRAGTVWTQRQVLTPGLAGYGVGTGLAQGAALALAGATASGRAYMFSLTGTTWALQQTFTSPEAPITTYADTVALSGTTALIGGDRPPEGGAYWFTQSGTSWPLQATLPASVEAWSRAGFFDSAVRGDRAVTGASGDSTDLASEGSAYVFDRTGTTWSPGTRLAAVDRAADDRLGNSVAVEGDLIVAGAHGDDVGANADQGSVVVFRKSGTAWSQEARLVASDGVAGAQLSMGDLALSQNTVVASSSTFLPPVRPVYVFASSGTVWTQQARLVFPGTDTSSEFGAAVDIEGDRLIVAAPGDSPSSAVFVYDRVGTTWTLGATVRSSYGAFDAADLAGDHIAVGGPTGASVFTLTGTTWVESRFRTTDADWAFVAPSGLTALAGAGSSIYLSDAYARLTGWTLEASPGGRITSFDGRRFTSQSGGFPPTVSVKRLDGFAGSTCSVAGDCATGYSCTDGVCCNASCGAACETCLASQGARFDGACSPVPLGTPGTPGCSANILCDGALGTCPSNCTSDVLCPGGTYCTSSGTCVSRKSTGSACNPATDCADAACAVCQSGNCVDGYCCATACGDVCDRCAAATSTGANGTCAPARDGEAPSALCASRALCDGTTTGCTTCATDGDCPGSRYCSGGNCLSKLVDGTACTGPSQCQSGNCVDGVCCDTVCNAPCDACSAAAGGGTDGTCALRAAGSAGSPTCPGSVLCSGTSAACPGGCTADAQCPGGQFCTNGGACAPSRGNGVACNPATDCAVPGSCAVCQSGNCVDGVCCNVACTDVCEACTAALSVGADGTCAAVEDGTAPTGACASNALCDGATRACPASCAADIDCPTGRFCDAGACVVKRAQGAACAGANQCQTGYCADGVCCSAACGQPCDACSVAAGAATDGVCAPAAAGTPGSPFCAGSVLCDGVASSCPSGCSADGQCPSGSYCTSSNTCVSRKSTGAACSPATDCANGVSCAMCTSGQCVDGFCCDAACAGVCDRCAAALSTGPNGTCSPAQDGLIPSGTCASNALCDGLGAGCAACVGDGDCPADRWCSAGSCLAKQVAGAGCAGANQCQSGHCADSVCCDSACGAPCDACSVAAGAASDGTCGVVAAGAAGAPACPGAVLCDGAAATCPGGCTADAQCPGGQYCTTGGACAPSRAVGVSCDPEADCADPGQCALCQSGECVDGFCCDSGCGGPCEACSAALSVGSNGTCAAAEDGTPPSAVCASNALCDGATRGCAAACVADADCPSGNYCAAGTCQPRHADGAACTGTNQCQSGYCVDGVCCNTACGQPCDACSLAAGAAADGVCGAVPTGTAGSPVCAGSVLCDGSGGSCPGGCSVDAQCPAGAYCTASNTCVTRKALGSSCNPATDCADGATCGMCASGLCVDGYCCNAACDQACDFCDAARSTGPNGTCSPARDGQAPTAACPSGALCDGATAACAAACVGNADCPAGTFCAAGSCVTKLTQGDPCTATSQCAAGYCVDGVCCDTLCDNLCEACTAALKTGGSDGTCGTARSGTDPHNDCSSSAAATCGQSGTCDGAGGCAYFGASTVCGPPTCVGNVSFPSVCTGPFVCGSSAAGTACDAYRCRAATGTCWASCSTDAECSAGHFCDQADSTCQPRRATGATCAAAGECASGYCADGVCCDDTCLGTCEACSAALKESGADDGTCGPARSGTTDAACTVTAAATCGETGRCDAQGACALHASGTACGVTLCDGNGVRGQVCDGGGACVAAATAIDCFPYVCASATCASPCGADTDCQDPTGWSCVAGECQQKRAQGLGCGAGSECLSGFCVDGVCCETACNGQCEACADTAAGLGTCVAVTGAPVDDQGTPRAACAGGGTPCEGACDGATRDGCTYPSTGTVCAGAACDVGSSRDVGRCDGAGLCAPGTLTACAPFACDDGTGRCFTLCATSGDCAAGATCTLSGACTTQGATCKDPYTVLAPDGSEASCAPYRCLAGACQQQCAFDLDCAPGFACSGGQCLPPQGTGGTGGGAGTGGSGGSGGSAGAGASGGAAGAGGGAAGAGGGAGNGGSAGLGGTAGSGGAGNAGAGGATGGGAGLGGGAGSTATGGSAGGPADGGAGTAGSQQDGGGAGGAGPRAAAADDGGCGCRVPVRSRSRAGELAALLALGLAAARRRRSGRA